MSDFLKIRTYSEYVKFAASILTYGYRGEVCASCWNIPCACPSFRHDMQAILTALEMGYC